MTSAASHVPAAGPFPLIAFIGTGRLAQTLARRMVQVGVPVSALFNRSRMSADLLALEIGSEASQTAQAAVDRAELIFMTTPDGAIAPTVAALRFHHGQAVVHCSGATEVDALQAAREQGAAIGAFHPIQIFADPATALRHVPGSTVAIEASGKLDSDLHAVAAALGYRAMRLPPGVRALYHCSTGYAASYLFSLLHEAAKIWATFGIAESDCLAALLPLAKGTLAAAEVNGLAASQAGPISRGDTAVVQRHIEALRGFSPQAPEFYRVLTRNQLELSRIAGKCESAVVDGMEKILHS